MGEIWVPWWNGRRAMSQRPWKMGRACACPPRKMLQTKDVWAASIAQDKRYAGRWCVSDALPEVAPARDHGGAGGRDTAGAARTVARPAADT